MQGPVTEAAALLAADPVVVSASRKQSASAVFTEGQIGQSFYDWFPVGQFPPLLCYPIEAVLTGLSLSGKPVETG